MKMSDVFELPIHYDVGNDCLIERDGTPCGQLRTDTLQEHAAHAINCHDELVTALEGALMYLEGDLPEESLSKAKAILEKAQ